MLRRRFVPLIALGVILFLAISFELARFFQTETHERTDILNVLEAQAKGDASAALALMAPSCRASSSCRATIASNARRLKRAGAPKILSLQSKTAYALGAKTGVTRVAWTVVGNGLPVVQCVLVQRSGTALAGRRVRLLHVSAPIGNTSTC